MARKALTARFVESVKVETRTDFWDDVVRGLVLRVSPTGVKSWTVVYTREGDATKRRVTLGKFPAISLERARAKALGAVSSVAEGADPAGSKRARRDAMTVEELGTLYLENYAKREKRTWAQDDRILKVDVFPEIGSMKIHAVKRRDILDIIEAKMKDGKPAQSNIVLAITRKMFNWAVSEDYLEESPARGIIPKGAKVRRERTLSDDEIKTIWNALPEVAISGIMADVIRLLLLTGQRSGEVCGMRVDEIDLENALWSIPSARTKNGHPHNVPLSDEALAIIRPAYERADKDIANAPLFTRIGEPMESNAVAHAVRLKLQLFKERWTAHDIRRTVATKMAEDIGILPHVIEASLNHISGFKAGVAGTYNRATYDNERRRALDMWGERCTAIAAGKASKIKRLAAVA